MEEPDDIADAFNRLFEIDLDWERRRGESEKFLIKASELEEFVFLCSYLSIHLKDTKIQHAIWTLTQNGDFILTAVLIDRVFMESLGINQEDAQKIYKTISENIMTDIFYIREEKTIATSYDARGILAPGGKFFVRNVRNAKEYAEIMDLFYGVEERQLLKAGLNQSSVAIILQRLKEYEQGIVANLDKRSSALTGKYVKAIDALHTFAQRIGGAAQRQGARAKSHIKLPSGKTIARSRDKIIGLATLWGDAVPLITSRDWGVASVISATAGATVAAVLPSYKKRD
ncbi:MAG: hypothetical protein JOZ32_17920 [Bryobacterales bacterium]|nr:hypothetical protein [Bryobacterales bacterium]